MNAVLNLLRRQTLGDADQGRERWRLSLAPIAVAGPRTYLHRRQRPLLAREIARSGGRWRGVFDFPRFRTIWVRSASPPLAKYLTNDCR